MSHGFAFLVIRAVETANGDGFDFRQEIDKQAILRAHAVGECEHGAEVHAAGDAKNLHPAIRQDNDVESGAQLAGAMLEHFPGRDAVGGLRLVQAVGTLRAFFGAVPAVRLARVFAPEVPLREGADAFFSSADTSAGLT